jgi:uncharacterized lipoprotein
MKKFILGIVVVGLAGCSFVKSPIKSRDDQYLAAQHASTLQVPVGASSAKLGSDFPISGNTYNTSKQAVSLVPPGSLAASDKKK